MELEETMTNELPTNEYRNILSLDGTRGVGDIRLPK
jgi:hypothetical protein